MIYARYFIELSVEETANMLGIAAGTVKSRTYRALNALKAIINTQYPYLREAFDV